MSVTVTLYAWWLWPWLAIGAIVFLPLAYIEHRNGNSSLAFWPHLWRAIRRRPYMVPAIIALWPIAIWGNVR